MGSEDVGLRARVAELLANPHARTIAVSAAAVAVTPLVLPLIKPALKATIKAGVMLFEKTKGTIAETREIIADIAAEAKSEAALEARKKATFTPNQSTPKATAVET